MHDADDMLLAHCLDNSTKCSAKGDVNSKRPNATRGIAAVCTLAQRVLAICKAALELMTDWQAQSNRLCTIAAVSSSVCRHVVMHASDNGALESASHIVWLDIPVHDAL